LSFNLLLYLLTILH